MFADGKTSAASKKGQFDFDFNVNVTIASLGDFNYVTYTSQGSTNQDWLRAFLIPHTRFTVMNRSEVLPNTKYTFSFLAKGTGTHQVFAYGNWTVPVNDSMEFTLTSDWKLYTLTVTTATTIPTSNVQFYIRTATAGSAISIMKPKADAGSTATSWIPSASEVTPSDYPNYTGWYVGKIVDGQSLDPTKYNWQRI